MPRSAVRRGSGSRIRLDRRRDDALLVAEGAEQRSLGDTRGFGQLARRNIPAVFAEQRQHRDQDRLAAVVGGQRAGTLSRERLDVHERITGSNHSPMLTE